MKENKIYLCPKHNVPLVKKPIMYGYPISDENNDVILGGCCIDFDSPKFGYECPIEKEAYYLGKDGNMLRLNE